MPRKNFHGFFIGIILTTLQYISCKPVSDADISIVWTLNNLNWLVANLNRYSLYSCKNQQLKTAIQVMDNRKIY